MLATNYTCVTWCGNMLSEYVQAIQNKNKQ